MHYALEHFSLLELNCKTTTNHFKSTKDRTLKPFTGNKVAKIVKY